MGPAFALMFKCRTAVPTRMTMRTPRCLVSLLVVAVAALSGCGDDDSPSAEQATTTTVAPRNVVEASAYDVELATWATLLNVGGQVGPLSDAGPYIMLAPDNNAFSTAYSNEEQQALLSPGKKGALVQLLGAHIVRGHDAGTDLQPGRFTTVAGTTLAVAQAADGYTVTDEAGTTAKVMGPARTTPNGVVYRIDKVLSAKS
jgi:uncharacterized surface protein with fasciclin (FAS1) repeats